MNELLRKLVMGDIEWTGPRRWNPIRGCSRISPGCENCYAETIAERFSDPGAAFEGYAVRGKGWTRKVSLLDDALDAPLRWREPQLCFVNSMSDLFHESISNEEIAAVFGVMAACPQHTFQVLTKRAKRMRAWFEWLTRAVGTNMNTGQRVAMATDPLTSIQIHASRRVRLPPRLTPSHTSWPLPNVWLGVSVEDQQRANERLPHLVRTPAAIRFVSAEPLLEPVDMAIWMYHGVVEAKPGDPDYDAIDWVIVGGESGHGARPFHVDWARRIVADCRAAGKPVFVKQFGAHPTLDGSTLVLRSRKGGDLAEWPEDLRIREFPR
jgi:protein gp37